MSDAVRVELAVPDLDGCPVAAASAATDAPATDVSRAVAPGDDGLVAEEFALPTDLAPDDAGAPADERVADVDLSRVATEGSRAVYRFRRDPGEPCVCDAVERLAGPVADVRAADGALHVSLHAPGVDAVRDVVADLRDQFGDVRVRTIARAAPDGDGDPVVVERDRLTDRQREVLETAHRMGYFDHPKGANAGEVADALDLASSTVREHLAAAQRKLLDAVLEA